MIFETGTMRLQSVWEVLSGKVNDVVICQETNAMRSAYYTVWIVKDHRIAKEILEMFTEQERQEKQACFESFTFLENLCFLFPYQEERPLHRFYGSTAVSGTGWSAIWLNYVEACLAAWIPYPILYLIIEQEQVQVQQDGSIHFNYCLDLEQLTKSKQAAECANICAEELLELFAEEQDKDFLGYELISSKLNKKQYSDLIPLYRDVKLLVSTQKKMPFLKTLQKGMRRQTDTIYRVLLAGSIFLLAVVITMAVSQLVYGEIPLFRLFQPLFHTIGTESLLQ